MKSIPLALFLFAIAFMPRIATAQATFPAFTGASVYVQGTEDVFDPVRAAIKSAEAKSPRRYYVVVLGSTGEWNQSPQQLVESLFEQWTKDAAASGKPLERANGTLILVAIEQRDIVVRTGQNLQGKYGLDQNALEKDLVPKAFMPKARDGDLPGALVSLIGAMETRIADQDAATAARKQMYSRNLPIAIGGGVLLVTLAGLGIYFWRFVRRFSRFSEAFGQFNGKLVELMERSDAIKQQHQLLPYSDKDFTEPMSGATLALYNNIEERLAKLRATWLELMDVRNEIERITATGKKHLEAAEKMLADKGKLPEVDALYQQCERDLATLGAAHEAAAAAMGVAKQLTDELPAKIAAIEAAGLSARPYDEQRAAIAQRLESLQSQLKADPIGTTALVAEVHAHLAKVAAVISQLLELDATWRKTGARREEIVGQVTAERAAGLKLDEEHANPDAPLDAAEKSLAVSLESLLDNRLDDTASATTEAQLALDAAVQLVANVRAAREYCREQLPAVENALAQTRVQQPPAEEHLRALERDFAAESWNNVAPNAVRAAELLGAATQAWRDATEMAADGRQQYVAAAARLKQSADANASAQTMLTAIGDRLRELNALREQCAQQRGGLLDAVRQLQTYLGKHADTVDQEARSHLAEASRIEEQVVAGLDSSRPNWPVVKQRLDQLAAALHSAREAAEADVRHRAALEATLQESETLSARVANTLRSHTADRPRANQAYRRAAAALAELRERRSNWKSLLAAANEAKQDLVNAEQWATQDIQLASQAAQAITAAERAVGSARSYVSLGISAESGVAASTLAEAQRQLSSQQYEQAIATAASAEQQARQAVQAAEQAAQMRRMQQEAERRRRDAERHASGPMAIPSLPTFTFGGGASSSPAPRPSQAATGNWSIGGGGSAHGNWSGGASHNKW